MRKSVVLLLSLLAVAGCATHATVLAGRRRQPAERYRPARPSIRPGEQSPDRRGAGAFHGDQHVPGPGLYRRPAVRRCRLAMQRDQHLRPMHPGRGLQGISVYRSGFSRSRCQCPLIEPEGSEARVSEPEIFRLVRAETRRRGRAPERLVAPCEPFKAGEIRPAGAAGNKPPLPSWLSAKVEPGTESLRLRVSARTNRARRQTPVPGTQSPIATLKLPQRPRRPDRQDRQRAEQPDARASAPRPPPACRAPPPSPAPSRTRRSPRSRTTPRPARARARPAPAPPPAAHIRAHARRAPASGSRRASSGSRCHSCAPPAPRRSPRSAPRSRPGSRPRRRAGSPPTSAPAACRPA